MTSNIYTRSAIQIIERALRLIRVIDPDTPLEPRERQNGIDALNGMIKFLQTKGFNLWRETEAVLILEQGQAEYKLGPNGDRCVDADNFVLSELSADALTGDVLINLTSTAGINGAPNLLAFDPTSTLTDWTATDANLTADNNGLVIENAIAAQGSASYTLETTPGQTYRVSFTYIAGTSLSIDVSLTDTQGTISTTNFAAGGTYSIEFVARQLTTNIVFANTSVIAGDTSTINALNYIDKNAGDVIGIFLDTGNAFYTTVVTISPLEIAQALPDDAQSGNMVYSYSELIPRPLDVIQTRYRDSIQNEEIPTTRWTRDRYFDQPDKFSTGTVTKWYYSPQLNNGLLYVWQPASQLNSVLTMTYIKPLGVFEDNADAPDFPSEWFDLLSFGTAYRLLAEYDSPQTSAQMVMQQYGEMLDSALGFDNDGDIRITIDYEGRR